MIFLSYQLFYKNTINLYKNFNNRYDFLNDSAYSVC